MFSDRLQISKSFQFLFEVINSLLFLLSSLDKVRDFDDLIFKCVQFIANATIMKMYKDLKWKRRKRRKKFLKIDTTLIFAKIFECRKYLTFSMMKRSFSQNIEVFEKIYVWIEMWKNYQNNSNMHAMFIND